MNALQDKDTTKEEQEKYLELVDKTKIRGFSNQITSVCCKYLGLDKSKVAFMGEFHLDDELFLSEILEILKGHLLDT